ncbi:MULTISPECIES: histidine kinase dimerization/phospho-acceptor domain-containing protein [Paenibacillus]|uniref:histidine kinase n=2 Tax=Paenibacillus polymyxa TaxID=1406 RepID=E3EAF7_PAEPS|nr:MULTISPECIES: histidine kinase dimerization/phospho-acceptor domain-containing protein [Paenibacillus]ADO58575.1 sensor protein [Paenibacillus polymyxa SC2]AJE52364.1 sensor protein [Paenibacillus polymyxa]KJD40139.1 sensor protein [Paenibacillus polymyxa]MDU8673055.1 histidine kinase dimerization/phospho-acceptor domain-containing protein [Paenibacillus polymyxa]MDU8697962.1 histidine kinase dimerization/phospho-acceptor domain-containing protein [Paenibacillus polymyxa]
MLSSVETRLAQFLSICSVFSTNLLVEKNKINKLISDISHQTKTPVANILLYAQLLSEHDLPEDSSSCIKALASRAEKLNFLTNTLVKTSRLKVGIITVSPRQESVQELLHVAREQMIPKADTKDISIVMENTPIHTCFVLKWMAVLWTML